MVHGSQDCTRDGPIQWDRTDVVRNGSRGGEGEGKKHDPPCHFVMIAVK